MPKSVLLYLALYVLLLTPLSCTTDNGNKTAEVKEEKVINAPHLILSEAEKLITLPLFCVNTEYPNKLSQTLSGDEDLLPPTVLHPAFYGCFDWHSSVHGHWSMVTLLKQFPQISIRDSVLELLHQNISSEKIQGEVEYFARPHAELFERTYGWAWLLKLAEELYTWEDTNARVLEKNLQPLTNLIVDKYIEYLPKLNYPIRVGTHSNTAFGLSFALDYALTTKNDSFKEIIKSRSKDFYLEDTGCPLKWEPGGYDFLSPCLEEVDLMRKVLPTDEFNKWMEGFMPQLASKEFYWEPGIVSDRSDGLLVHLDGVNFSRAWCLYGLSKNPKYAHLSKLADEHLAYSYPNLVEDDYEGGHWLASFAIMALNSRKSTSLLLESPH